MLIIWPSLSFVLVTPATESDTTDFSNFYLVLKFPTFSPTLTIKITMKEWSSKLILLDTNR